MKLHNKIILFFTVSIYMFSLNNQSIYAKEPTMEYHFVIQEQKIKSAHFVWRTCLEEMRLNNEITNKEIIEINKYLTKSLECRVFESKFDQFDRQKEVLSISRVDNLVKKGLMSEKQCLSFKNRLQNHNYEKLLN